MNWPLDDGSTIVAFAGDWHAQTGGVWEKLEQLAGLGVTRLYHVGDFALWPDKSGRKFLDEINGYAEDLGIALAVTPGNHEDWRYLGTVFAASDQELGVVRSRITVFPRGHRWTHSGRSFVSFGGGASIDFEYRRLGRSWWPEELPTEADVEALSASGVAEIMIMHDSPAPGTPQVEAIRSDPGGWSDSALAYAEAGAQRATAAWAAVQPKLLIHGHFHVRDEIRLPTGQRIVSLAAEQTPGNVITLDLKSMSTTWLEETE